ncbi:MAG: hypothetical protein Q7K45_07620 [Nanoarchaeota archaeon]|nr:hypothetical protein [Nanoarchaeota archaeon]
MTSREYSPRRYRRIREYIHDAHTIFDILQQCPERAIPITAPMPDRVMTFHFEKPLADSVLEQLAREGYRCINPQESVCDKAAE